VAVSGTNNLRVFDRTTFNEFTQIPTGIFPCDIDMRPKHNFAYAPNRFEDSVSIVDMDIGKEVARLPTTPAKAEPFMLTLSPDATKVVVEFAKAPVIKVLDTKTRQFEKEIPLQAPGLTDEFTPDGSLDFITHLGADFITVLDAKKWEVLKTIKVGAGAQMAAFSSDSKFAYVPSGQQNLVNVIDLAKLEIIKTIRVGAGPAGVLTVRLEKAPGT
jgi:DNA-binding beta-propeller fold protein YncE